MPGPGIDAKKADQLLGLLRSKLLVVVSLACQDVRFL